LTPHLRPAQLSDLLAATNRDGWQGSTLKLAQAQLQQGPAFTAVEGDVILGTAGVIVPWHGMGQAWMVLRPELNGQGVWLTKTVRRMLDDMTAALDLHRLEAISLADSAVNQAWLQALGFSRELGGVAQGYFADGRSAIRYEKVRR